MQFLNEHDLNYFFDLEKEGKAVIYQISPEDLLRLDVSKLREERPGTVEVSDLLAWLEKQDVYLEEHHAAAQKLARENDLLYEGKELAGEMTWDEPGEEVSMSESREKGNEQRWSERSGRFADSLIGPELTDEKAEILQYAIKNGLTEKQLSSLLKKNLTVKSMREICELYISLREEE